MNQKVNYQKVIIRGKEIMRGSNDPAHDYQHAENVAKMGQKVYDELISQNYPGIQNISREMVETAAWWHDCFKAKVKKRTLIMNFIEGQESVRIINKEVGNLIPSADLEKINKAVEKHGGLNILIYLFRPRAYSPLYKILMEADAHDIIDPDRFRRHTSQRLTITDKSWIIFDLIISQGFPIYLQTRITKENLSKRLSTFTTLVFKKLVLSKNE